jgi:hypothetical protein
MDAHAKLLTFETRVALLATVSLALLAVSLALGFWSDRPECWWAVKIATGVAALCAEILVVVNITLNG